MKLIKFISLILLSLSVYFIYNQTKDTTKTIVNIGDGLSLGINSYGIQEYSYIDYYQDELQKRSKVIRTNYAKPDLTIKELIKEIQDNNELKRNLREADQVFLTIGYNDLLYYLSLEDNIYTSNITKNVLKIQKEYEELLKELNKYYKKRVIIIGYYPSNREDYYLNRGIQELNKVLKKSPNVVYIDTYYLLNNREKYFSNPHSYYPNYLGYQRIARKIIEKTLEM